MLSVQVCSDSIAVQCHTVFGNSQCSVLLCKPGWQQAWATANTPMDICCWYRCAVAQQQCSATLLLKICPLLSAAVQKRLTAGLGHCKYTCGGLLSVQVCSDPTAVQCQTAFSNCPLLSAAVQKRLTTGLEHCKYT